MLSCVCFFRVISRLWMGFSLLSLNSEMLPRPLESIFRVLKANIWRYYFFFRFNLFVEMLPTVAALTRITLLPDFVFIFRV